MKNQFYFGPAATPTLRSALFSILILLTASGISAQDRVILKNGNTVEAKVLEIQLTEIKYKRFDNLNGPVYSVLKSEVFLVMYENGTKEVINELSPATLQNDQPTTHPIKTAQQTDAAVATTRKPSVEQKSKGKNNLVFGGISLPLKDDGTQLGFFAGYELNHPISETFGLVTHISLSYNKWEGYDYYYSEDGELNSRLLVGPMLSSSGNAPVVFYGSALIGTDYQVFTGSSEEKFSFAYGAGVGLLFSHSFDLGLRFIHHTSEYATPLLHASLGVRF